MDAGDLSTHRERKSSRTLALNGERAPHLTCTTAIMNASVRLLRLQDDSMQTRGPLAMLSLPFHPGLLHRSFRRSSLLHVIMLTYICRWQLLQEAHAAAAEWRSAEWGHRRGHPR